MKKNVISVTLTAAWFFGMGWPGLSGTADLLGSSHENVSCTKWRRGGVCEKKDMQ